MGAKRTLRERLRPELDAYYGGCFERLCRDALPALYEEEGLSAAFEVGEYWDKSVQIDVVGLRDDRWTDLGECKWGTIRSAPAVERELEAACARYPNPEGATLVQRVFVRRLPRGRQRGANGSVLWHDLEQLYQA